MADVDLVISALFETSGVRLEGDCARLLPELITSKTKPTKKTFIDFTAPILLSCAECESVKHLEYSRVSSRPLPARKGVVVLNGGALIS